MFVQPTCLPGDHTWILAYIVAGIYIATELVACKPHSVI